MSLLNENRLRDKFLGCLFGVALGDCLGIPHEFTYGRLKYSDQITQYAQLARGQVSDDTEMMLALALSIKQSKGYNTDQAVVEYCRWANSGVFDLGINTRTLFRQMLDSPKRMLSAYQVSYQNDFTQRSQAQWSQSNGCLMRAAPLLFIPKQYKAWREDCKTSNPHPVCIDASDVYFRMLHSLLEEKNDPLSPDWDLTVNYKLL